MKEILNTIFARIKECAPEVNFIDVNLGQLLLEAPPVMFPCVLVDISNVEYTQLKPRQQKASATISLQFGFSVLSPSDYNSTPELREEAMQHYEIISKVASALHGFDSQYFNPLVRRSLQREQNTYPRTFTLHFTTNFLQLN